MAMYIDAQPNMISMMARPVTLSRREVVRNGAREESAIIVAAVGPAITKILKVTGVIPHINVRHPLMAITTPQVITQDLHGYSVSDARVDVRPALGRRLAVGPWAMNSRTR